MDGIDSMRNTRSLLVSLPFLALVSIGVETWRCFMWALRVIGSLAPDGYTSFASRTANGMRSFFGLGHNGYHDKRTTSLNLRQRPRNSVACRSKTDEDRSPRRSGAYSNPPNPRAPTSPQAKRKF